MSDPIAQAKEALLNDDARTLHELLERHPVLKARINDPVGPFDSPAVLCARSREVLDLLLAAGADINARSRWWAGGFGLLHLASPDLATYAIERGAFVDVHAAARLGMIEKLAELVSTDPAIVRARGGDGQTPLHFASTVQIAEYLLDRGAEIDARDVDHESAPAQHMVRDRQDVARCLVAHGCKTDILMAAALGDVERVRRHLDAAPSCIRTIVSEDYFPMRNSRAGGSIYLWALGPYKTPHAIAREFGRQDVLHLLLERSPRELALVDACEAGDETVLTGLLTGDPELAARLSDADRRRIAYAAQNNEADAVRRMLAAGWPVNARGRYGGTPLHWAAWHGNAALVRLVLRWNPPLEDVENDFQSTPLGWAIHGSEHGWYRSEGDYPGTAEALLAAGAKLPEPIAGSDAVREILRRSRRG